MKKNKSSETLIASGVLDIISGVGLLALSLFMLLATFISGIFGSIENNIINKNGTSDTTGIIGILTITIAVIAILALIFSIVHFLLGGFQLKYSKLPSADVYAKRGRLIFWGIVQIISGLGLIIFTILFLTGAEEDTSALSLISLIFGAMFMAAGILKTVSGGRLNRTSEDSQKINYPNSYIDNSLEQDIGCARGIKNSANTRVRFDPYTGKQILDGQNFERTLQSAYDTDEYPICTSPQNADGVVDFSCNTADVADFPDIEEEDPI